VNDDEVTYEYRVMYRIYYGADNSWVLAGKRSKGWGEWREMRSRSARANKSNTYGTLAVAKQQASAERNHSYHGNIEVKIQRRAIRPEDWEDVQ